MGVRLSIVGLAVAVIAVLLGTTVLPTHVTFGAGSVGCGTVLHPDRGTEVRDYCPRAGANQLRAALGLGGVLVLTALTPLAIGRFLQRRRAAWAVWAVGYSIIAIAGTALLGMLEYSPPGRFFDL